MLPGPEMDLNEFVAQITGIAPPWTVLSAKFDGEDTVDVEIGYDRSSRPSAPSCPACGGKAGYYDMVDKTWRHTDMCDYICKIHGRTPRIKCKDCGTVSRIAPPWESDSIGKYTKSFEDKVIRLSKEMPVASVCREMRLDDSTVWTIIDRYVEKCMSKQDLSHLHTYYVDEKAIETGRVYLSTFLDQDKKVAFVAPGNDSSSVVAFRDHLVSKNGKVENVKHISSDMGTGYLKGARECFPDAKVTIDRFHLTEHMTKSVNDVRKREYAALAKDDEEKRKMLRGTRFLFLKNYNNLDDDGKEAIPSLMRAFPDLGRIYTFKEMMRGFWEKPTKYDAYLYIMKWCEDARKENIFELNGIVDMIERNLEGILNWYTSRINNGVMEGFNSVLQAFKGRARGYRSFERYRTMIYLRGSNLC